MKKLEDPVEGHCFLYLQEKVSVLILNNESRQSRIVRLQTNLTSLDNTQEEDAGDIKC